VDGSLVRLDTAGDELTRYPILDRPIQAFAASSRLFVTTGDSPPPLSPLPADKVLNVALAEDYVDDLDPATAFPNPARLQVEYATGATLLQYPDAPAPRGSVLAPYVAAALPAVSDGGRTYTFRVRRGFRFSPPSNAPVTAETFRYAIERALSPRLGPNTPAIEFAGDIVGARAFHQGKTDHVSGIRVQGDEISFTLEAPAGDFPVRISLPYFSAVPIGTPLVKGGVQDRGIPSAGPYYVFQRWLGGRLVLQRNPNYGGTRPRHFQRIVYDLNSGARRTVDRINSGLADYTEDFQQQSTFAPRGPLDDRYGASATQRRLFLTPQLGVAMFELNTEHGVFTDVSLRRAFNFAIDRRQLAAALGEPVSESYLPPGLGVPDPSVYPLTADPAKARALLRGRRPTVTLVTCQRADCEARAAILHANLAAVGMKLVVKRVEDQYAATASPNSGWDITAYGWFADYPDPFNFLNAFLDSAGFRQSWDSRRHVLARPFTAALRHAAAVTGLARTRAYAAVNTTLVRDAAPYAAFSTPVLPEFFSKRVGCQIFQPTIGAVDLGSLCVR
jgi:peptide/nickel transport system substrate-binding protein